MWTVKLSTAFLCWSWHTVMCLLLGSLCMSWSCELWGGHGGQWSSLGWFRTDLYVSLGFWNHYQNSVSVIQHFTGRITLHRRVELSVVIEMFHVCAIPWCSQQLAVATKHLECDWCERVRNRIISFIGINFWVVLGMNECRPLCRLGKHSVLSCRTPALIWMHLN
jgi:hypothetical protein